MSKNRQWAVCFMRCGTGLINYAFLTFAISAGAAAQNDLPRCQGVQGELQPLIIDQLAKMDRFAQSLRDLVSSAQAARIEIENEIARGNNEPALSERKVVIAAHENALQRQVKELKTLRQRLCDAAR